MIIRIIKYKVPKLALTFVISTLACLHLHSVLVVMMKLRQITMRQCYGLNSELFWYQVMCKDACFFRVFLNCPACLMWAISKSKVDSRDCKCLCWFVFCSLLFHCLLLSVVSLSLPVCCFIVCCYLLFLCLFLSVVSLSVVICCFFVSSCLLLSVLSAVSLSVVICCFFVSSCLLLSCLLYTSDAADRRR